MRAMALFTEWSSHVGQYMRLRLLIRAMRPYRSRPETPSRRCAVCAVKAGLGNVWDKDRHKSESSKSCFCTSACLSIKQ